MRHGQTVIDPDGTPHNAKSESGLAKAIMMGESICHYWAKSSGASFIKVFKTRFCP